MNEIIEEFCSMDQDAPVEDIIKNAIECFRYAYDEGELIEADCSCALEGTEVDWEIIRRVLWTQHLETAKAKDAEFKEERFPLIFDKIVENIGDFDNLPDAVRGDALEHFKEELLKEIFPPSEVKKNVK